MTHNKPKITILGAGPGDPELITVKGLKRIQSADVILYDALVEDTLLTYATPQCQCIYVGKRGGAEKTPQSMINKMLIQYARLYGHVVRLKGGDPFIFGRGHEELEEVRNAGVPVEVIPGISSSTGLATRYGVPLTKRGVNESFWVLTGTTQLGTLSQDIYLAARSKATAVILMGVRQLENIVSIYRTFQDDDLPIMVIENGSLPNERVTRSTIGDIIVLSRQLKIASPAIIIIGEAVAEGNVHNSLQHEINRLYASA